MIVLCEDVTVVHGEGEAVVRALDGVSLQVDAKESVALIGRSGSGKTTLLHILGGLAQPSAGRVEAPEVVGYVFQGANLLPHFSAFENVSFAAHLASSGLDPAALLSLVGLATKGDHLPAEMSGGESQRVAVARALAQRPPLLLCDEPTGHLDSDTAARVLDLIEALRREFGFALVVATHDNEVAARFERRIELEDGRIVHEARS